MIPVGTQYYRPPAPKAEFWEADFKLMEKCGFNTVRGWAMWSWLNPKEGVYDWADVDRLLDLGRKHGIGVILLINIESSPSWLHKKHSEMVYVNKNGRSYPPQTVHNTAVGGFPGQCLDYPEIKGAAADFITNLVKHCSGHPALLGWEPHNEPLIEPARYSHEIFCYCPQSIQAFRGWLKRKYKTIGKLNDVWKRKFNDFDEVIPPYELGSFADWMDWRMFAIDGLVAQDAWRIGLIRENDPKHPVLMHSRGGGDRRDIPCDGTDDWRLAALADKFGYANFPQGKTIFEHVFSGDICRSAAQGKEFWMHELQSGPFGIGLQRNNPFFAFLGEKKLDVDVAARLDEVGDVTADRLAMWSLIPFSQGAKGLLYWQFRTEQFGTECGFNLVNLDGTPTPRLEMAKRLAGFIKQNEPLLSAARPPQSKVAIGYSVANALMTHFAEGNVNAYLAAYLGANRVLQHIGHQIDVARIDASNFNDDLSKYDVLVLPLPIFSDAATADKLTRFVKNGGTLISEASFAEYDDTFFSSDRVPGMGLDKVFGCHREIISTRNDIMIRYRGLPVPSRFYEEILIPDGGEVAGTYADGRPAVVANSFGKGKAVYFGTNVLMDYIFNEDENFSAVMADLTSGVQRFARIDNRLCLVRWLQAKDRRLVFLFNGTPRDAACTLTLDCEAKRATDIFNEEDVKFDVHSGTSRKMFYLKPYAAKVIRI